MFTGIQSVALLWATSLVTLAATSPPVVPREADHEATTANGGFSLALTKASSPSGYVKTRGDTSTQFSSSLINGWLVKMGLGTPPQEVE